MEQSPGQGQSLALAAGEVGAFFLQRGVKPLLSLQEIRQTGLLQHLPQLLLGGLGIAHQQIFPDGPLKEIAVVAYVGNGFHQAFLPNPGKLDSPQSHRTGIVSAAPHEDGGHGGLSAAALPHQSHKGALGHMEIYPIQDLPLPIVGEAQIPAGNFAAGGINFLPALFRLRQIQQPENLIAGRHAVHGNVKEASQLPHGNEEIRRQKDDGQAAPQAHLLGPVLGHRQNHAQGRSAVGDQIHDGHGIQLHGQHLHGDLSELFRLPVHLLIFVVVRLVDFQSGQSLEILQEGVAQGSILPPVFGQKFLGKGLHRRDSHRNQRHAEQKHRRRRQIHKA